MPIYEYRCDICQHTLEILQKIADTPLKICPSCGKDSLEKLISASAFHLKGQGWYKTDYKASEKSSPTKTDTKTDNTQATKTENATPTSVSEGK